MSLNLSALKKSSTQDLLAKLAKHSEEKSQKKFGTKDERYWSPTIDASGNGSAIIRFLPPKTEDSFPFVKLYKHAFQENGMWYINNCPTTLGIEHKCPVCEEGKRLWNSGIESDKEIVRKRKRKLSYIANVLIVKDPANPENEGTVRLFKFGSKIFEKIEACYKVDPDLDEEPVNPFSFFDGVNFNMKIQTVQKFLNYDKCKFVKAADLYDGDEAKLTEVMEVMADLQAIVDPKEFKEYADLKARFEKVILGEVQNKDEDDKEFEQKAPAEKYSAPAKTEAKKKEEPKEPDSSSDAEDDDLAFFRNLAQ